MLVWISYREEQVLHTQTHLDFMCPFKENRKQNQKSLSVDVTLSCKSMFIYLSIK